MNRSMLLDSVPVRPGTSSSDAAAAVQGIRKQQLLIQLSLKQCDDWSTFPSALLPPMKSIASALRQNHDSLVRQLARLRESMRTESLRATEERPQ